jgi:hypothetical protein
MRIGIGIGLTGPQKAAGGGAPAPTVLPYTLLDGFEETAGRTGFSTNSLTLVPPVVQGAGAVQTYTNGAVAINLIKTALDDTAAPSTWGADPLLAVMVDMGDDPMEHAISGLQPQITVAGTAYAYRNDTTVAGTALPAFGGDTARGKRWRSFAADRLRATNWAGANFMSAPAGTKTARFDPQLLAASNNNHTTATFDAFVRVQRHKPVVMLTWDDVNERQYDLLHPMLVARNLKSTSYVCMGLLDTGSKFSLAEAQIMKDSGLWAFCTNSNRLDNPLFAFDTPELALAQLNDHAAEIVAAGLATADKVKHAAFSYGPTSYRPTPVTLTCTANGTATVTITAPQAWSNSILPGMLVKGTGLGVAPTVVSVPTSSSIVLSAAVTSGTLSLTFCSNSRGLTLTANGTTTITGINTTGLFPGQVVRGFNVPANTTVASIVTEGVSGSITTNNNIPSTCLKASFFHASGPWAYNKMEDLLLADGWLTGRRGTSVGGVYSGFGVDPKVLMGLPSTVCDAGVALFGANLQSAIDDCTDLIGIGHFTAGTVSADVEGILDLVAAARDAGDIDVLTVPEWHERIITRTFA